MKKDCFHLGERKNDQGATEYFIYTVAKDQPVTPYFDDIWDLKEHLTMEGTSEKYDQVWSGSAVNLLEEYKHIPKQINFIKPYNSNYGLQFERWKEKGGECVET